MRMYISKDPHSGDDLEGDDADADAVAGRPLQEQHLAPDQQPAPAQAQAVPGRSTFASIARAVTSMMMTGSQGQGQGQQ
jgi:hypothetical protein